ncbi:hypothetical protein [Sporosarcina sp. P33]|uniref:hypothetical protein n=1 Tax=Sporosarcina sp. P33 TaxID=1930764 RepID=UPI0009C00682|nr:hypothetical protein [Sporosarcina sp. P33]ARD47580.1 hypothetical protein SporoP33_04555 [Sporosarcina sp. P33]
MPIKLLVDVLHSGTSYKADTIISAKNMTKKEVQRLIDIKAAEKTNETPAVEDNGAPPATQDIESEGLNDADDLMSDDEVYKEIDEGFSMAELKREAEGLEMEFAKNISKKDLIDQIIAEEQDEHFLDILDQR